MDSQQHNQRRQHQEKSATFAQGNLLKILSPLYQSQRSKRYRKGWFFNVTISFLGFCVWIPKTFFDRRKIRKVSLLEEQIWIIPFGHSTGQNWPLQIHDQILNFFCETRKKGPDSNCHCKVWLVLHIRLMGKKGVYHTEPWKGYLTFRGRICSMLFDVIIMPYLHIDMNHTKVVSWPS